MGETIGAAEFFMKENKSKWYKKVPINVREDDMPVM